MEKFIEPNLLPDNADSVKEDHYSLTLTKDQIIVSKDDLAKISIEVKRLEVAEKERRSDHKAEIDPKKEEKDRLINEIKTGTREKYGKIYLLSDHAENKMAFYSEEGNLLNERPLLPEERQLKMRIDKTGTNN